MLFAATAGKVLELASLENFKSGGSVQLRSVNSDQSARFEKALDPMSHVDVDVAQTDLLVQSPLKKAHLEQKTIYWPSNPNFPGIDAYFLLDESLVLVQATVSPKRPLPMDKMQEFLKRALPVAENAKRIQLWFMVPLRHHAEFHVPRPSHTEALPVEIKVDDADQVGSNCLGAIPLDILVASWMKKSTR